MTATPVDSGITDFLLGETAGDYALESFIAQGQFGLVFMAKHVLTGLPAAVKILNPKRYQPTNLIDFDNEGLILERLNDCDGAVKLISRG